MSSFSGLNTAYTGLNAARAALEVTGQNVANANVDGYTRQRVNQATLQQTTLATYATPSGYGDGVQVTSVSRLNDAVVDARVRSTAATSAYWSSASDAIGTVEDSLNEPSSTGLSSKLTAFFNAWQTMASSVGGTSASGAANALIAAGQNIATAVQGGYEAVADAWSDAYAAARSTVTSIDDAAAKVADLNTTIRDLSASGGNVNSLLDQRDQAVATLSKLAGATTRSNPDGTIDVVVGGNALVSGGTARSIVVGNAVFTGSATVAPAVTWKDTGTAVSADGGELAARVASLGPSNASGTGGAYAEAAKAYDAVAATVADQVNALHSTGYTASGTLAGNFFSYTPGSAATSLAVVPTGVAGVATAASGKGANDATVADQIAQLGTAAGSPGTVWTNYVARVGSQSSSAAARAGAAATAATAATTAQTSASGVDLDEETSNLVIYQHAYQANARVISTINDILDTLIGMGAR